MLSDVLLHNLSWGMALLWAVLGSAAGAGNTYLLWMIARFPERRASPAGTMLLAGMLLLRTAIFILILFVALQDGLFYALTALFGSLLGRWLIKEAFLPRR